MPSLHDARVTSHWTNAPGYIRRQAQRPRHPPGERRADGTAPPKKKCSTHFCIRIYYFKGSLKIKILYSIKNSFVCLCVCVGERNGARGARGWGSALPGGLSPPRGPARRGHRRAHWPPSGVVCSERETTPGLLLSGLERVGETHGLRLRNGADDLSPNTRRQNESILILLPSQTRDPTSKRRAAWAECFPHTSLCSCSCGSRRGGDSSSPPPRRSRCRGPETWGRPPRPWAGNQRGPGSELRWVCGTPGAVPHYKTKPSFPCPAP